eukprot:228759_1
MTSQGVRHKMKIAKLTDKSQAYDNCVYVNPADLQVLNVKANDQILIDEQQVSLVKTDPKLQANTLGCSGLLWKALHLTAKTAVGTTVLVEPWNNRQTPVAQTVSVVVDTYSKAETLIKVEELEKYVREHFKDKVFCKDQRFIIRWIQYDTTYWLSLLIGTLYEANQDMEQKTDTDSPKRKRQRRQKAIKFATINDKTTVNLVATTNPYMKLIYPKGQLGAGGVAFNIDAEQMGIGGLDAQFGIIFRRAFASRLFPADIVKQLGIKHVKGMLLFGPPGTGKTLIARNIGGMLTENDPKVINGPEVLNKYVGQSEENIRKLFEDAIVEQKEKGDESSLHIIIFDEIDAICKQRGSAATSGSGVHDTVVNQLLSMIDGVNALNNVLVIGMTNRKDLLDDALLRSGRLEVHIEIGLPDEEGREQIFRIHTKSLRDNGFLDEHISISGLAKRTKNYTGAEIEGVVRSAVSYAMQTQIDVENIGKIDVKKLRNIRITQEYFDLALEEVMPELGKKKVDEQLSFMYNRGIIDFNEQIVEIKAFVGNVLTTMSKSQSSSMNRQALLMRGDMGSGKSAMASYIANEIAKWPFIRVISADNYVGAADISICQSINKIFTDAYKSNYSIIILDDVERLIGYTMGPRFSNSVLQAILTCIRRLNTTDVERKVFVIATCTNKVSRELGLEKQFDFVRDMPTIKSQAQFEKVVVDSGHDKFCRPNLNDVVKAFPINSEKSRGVGIADLLTVLELAIDDDKEITSQSLLTAWRSKFTSHGVYDTGLLLDDSGFE